MSTLAEELAHQHYVDMWRAAASECIFEMLRGDFNRRFMMLWD